MNIKLIVSDIDNTLLRTDGVLTPETTGVLEEAAASGISTVLASSRTPATAQELLDRVGDLRYMILLTGCRIADMKSGRRIYCRAMPPEAALDIVEYFERQEDCYVETCSGESFLLPQKSLAYIRRIRAFTCYLRDLRPAVTVMPSVSAYLRSSGAEVEKFFFYTKDPAHFQTILQGIPHRRQLKLVSPTPGGMDVLPPAVSKGEALRFLLGHLNLRQEQVMVLGDSENDADMFLENTFNVAVGNAYPSLKKRASFVSRSNDEDGVAYAVRRFVLDH